MDLATISSIITQTLVYATPLILTALGGTFSERSGVVNVGLEGIMVMGAFSSVVFNLTFADTFGAATPWIACLVGGVVGIVFSLLHAVATINLRADHIISGTVINLMAPALGFPSKSYLSKRTNRYDYTIIWLFFFPRIVKNSSNW